MNPLLNIAVKAARRAGQTLIRHFDRLERITVEVKGPGDFVSAVDRMAEDDIIDILRARYPRHRIVAEERGVVEGVTVAAGDGELSRHPRSLLSGGGDGHGDGDGDGHGDGDGDGHGEGDGDTLPRHPRSPLSGGDTGAAKGKTKGRTSAADQAIEWLIDPLDGTTNYLHGHPHFAVSIAACEGGRVQHAVVYDPLRDEMFTASRGQGAYLNDRRIRVTSQRRMRRVLLATGVGALNRSAAGRARFAAWRRCFDSLLPRVVDIRRGGSAALDLAYTAAGRVDGYWQPRLAPWDMAAGALLVREAGGLVADFHGGHNYLESGEIIASNPFVFNELLATVTSALEVGEGAESADSAARDGAAQPAPSAANITVTDAKPRATIRAKTLRKVATEPVDDGKIRVKTGDKTGIKKAAKANPRDKTGAKPARKTGKDGVKNRAKPGDKKARKPGAKPAARKTVKPDSRAKHGGKSRAKTERKFDRKPGRKPTNPGAKSGAKSTTVNRAKTDSRAKHGGKTDPKTAGKNRPDTSRKPAKKRSTPAKPARKTGRKSAPKKRAKTA